VEKSVDQPRGSVITIVVDYHVHTRASPDAKGSMSEYARKAKQKKIEEVGFSDHIFLRQVDGWSDFLVHEMPAYVQGFLRFKQKTEVPFKLGVEVDFFRDEIEKTAAFIRKYPFDYVIGSVHVIGNWAIDEPSKKDEYSRRDPFGTYEEYFRLVREMCECRLFDVLGHPDLIKIFGIRPKEDLIGIYEDTAETIASSQMCVEINAKGLERPCREIYPSEQFLKVLYDHDVPITFGSDAHEPNDSGKNLKEAVRLAKKVGYAEACRFSCRKKEPVKI
jgi:histidinol-phosphatase (PHP family)